MIALIFSRDTRYEIKIEGGGFTMETLEMKFDRLQWIATARAAHLFRESGLDKTHYVAQGRVAGEGGKAVADAAFGDDLCDTEKKIVGHRQLTPPEVGLEDEIICFVPAGREDATDREADYLMKRTYVFDLAPNKKPKSGCVPVAIISITLMKQNRSQDWVVALEFVRDYSREGDKQMVIFREGDDTVAKDGRILN